MFVKTSDPSSRQRICKFVHTSDTTICGLITLSVFFIFVFYGFFGMSMGAEYYASLIFEQDVERYHGNLSPLFDTFVFSSCACIFVAGVIVLIKLIVELVRYRSIKIDTLGLLLCFVFALVASASLVVVGSIPKIHNL